MRPTNSFIFRLIINILVISRQDVHSAPKHRQKRIKNQPGVKILELVLNNKTVPQNESFLEEAMEVEENLEIRAFVERLDQKGIEDLEGEVDNLEKEEAMEEEARLLDIMLEEDDESNYELGIKEQEKFHPESDVLEEDGANILEAANMLEAAVQPVEMLEESELVHPKLEDLELRIDSIRKAIQEEVLAIKQVEDDEIGAEDAMLAKAEGGNQLVDILLQHVQRDEIQILQDKEEHAVEPPKDDDPLPTSQFWFQNLDWGWTSVFLFAMLVVLGMLRLQLMGPEEEKEEEEEEEEQDEAAVKEIKEEDALGAAERKKMEYKKRKLMSIKWSLVNSGITDFRPYFDPDELALLASNDQLVS